MNRTEKRPPKRDNPIHTANCFSRWSFWWLKDLFTLGLKRPITEDELYETKFNLRSDDITKKFVELWDLELKKKSPSILRLIFKLYGASLLFWGLAFSALETVIRLIQPLCLGGLVAYFAPGQTDISKNEAYLYAFGIIMSIFILLATFHPLILWIFEVGTRMRLGCCGLLYRKALGLSKSATNEGLSGKLINIMSNDLTRFEYALAFLHDIWKGPMEAILFGYFIYREIGVSAIIGMAFLLSFIPLQAWIGKKAAQYRLQAAKRTDFRVKIMNEIISGIQVIKMYAWEQSFAGMVDKIRKKEINVIRGSAFIRATLVSFTMISRLSIFISLVSYIYFNNLITARKVFIVSSFFSILNYSMVYFWPLAITCVAEGYISAKRVQEFLLQSIDKPGTNAIKDDDNDYDGMNITKSNGIGKKPLNRKIVVPDEKINKAKNKYENGGNGHIGGGVADGETTELLQRRIENLNNLTKGMELVNATAVWELKKDEKGIVGISTVSLKVEPNELCVIIGQVGSGKSTLFNVILGELELDDGTITIDGSISYASQEPWLFEGSVRSNIIFIEEYDEKRYKDVIRVCALERDLRILPQGDATIVGERGISLSGGQKARVNLARAIYKKSDIYLLDDPLSAVDAHVGKHIFEECIEKYLHDKICILITHQLQYLNNVKHVVVMNDGRIDAQGSYKELKSSKKDIFYSQHSFDETNSVEEKTMKKIDTIPKILQEVLDDEADDRKENQVIGSVSFDIYKTFFKSVNSLSYILFIVLMFIIAQAAMSGVDYYVSQWVNWEEDLARIKMNTMERQLINISTTENPFKMNESIMLSNDTETLIDMNSTLLSINATDGGVQQKSTTTVDPAEKAERERFIMIYTILIVIAVYVFLHRTFAFFIMCLKISINLHDKLFRGITRATMYFFNTNPSGRILNRFSKDIFGIDSSIPPALIDCISFFLELTAIVIIVAVVNYLLIVPTVAMGLLLYAIRVFYINTGRCIKRIDSLTRSPVYSHTNATLQGLSTIRAFKAQDVLEQEFHEYQNHNSSAWYLFLTTTRAFALWLDLVCLLYITFVTLSFLVLDQSTMGGNVGLAITQCINLIGMCQWGMRQTAELENQMTSVERVLEYASLEPEPPLESEPKHCPPLDWPNAGEITFNNLSLKYSDNGGYVLKNLTFTIRRNEKVGIVGRTGAGKSSIIQAVFRLANNEGSIVIDGIDTNTLGLHDLRKKISIIPQDPILFSGSLRFNLDPFDEKNDDEMWSALAQVELKNFVMNLNGGLDCKMSDGGSNFSMGQRQLVCLARAILRNNKILILDEATANVDPETDKLIQATIRNKFVDCTVLTIAHRLHTVMDNDRVLLVDDGRIREFDHPYELLMIPDGYLRRLVDQTGASTAAKLLSIAQQNYNK